MPNQSVIAAGHPLTTDAAAFALESGGNAFDAAVSGWLVSCLSEPVLTSPAGGGFAMVKPATGSPRLYDFFTQTPRHPSPDGHTFPLEADFGSTRQVFHLGAGSVATPGCVAGILQMHKDFGVLPFKECAEPARHHAREGLTITSHAATLLQVVAALYGSTPASKNLFASTSVSGDMLQEGESFHNPDFENVLDMLIAEGARWFYEGDIGRQVSELCQREGGHLRRSDFSDYRVVIRKPLEVKHNGSSIWLNPPPSMGGTLIAIGLLSSMDGIEGAYPFSEPTLWQDWIDPMRLMSLLRSTSANQKLDEQNKKRIHSATDSNHAVRKACHELFPPANGQAHATGTTQLSIIDSEGNEVSMTTSNGAGSAIIPEGTGFMLNNMLGEEDLQPEGMHTWKPDTRLSSMMAPTLAHLQDGRHVAFGSGGSNRIRSTVLQLLRHLVDRNTNLEEAVLAPRLHWENNELHAETEAAAALYKSIPDADLPVIEHQIPNLFFGGAHSVCQKAGASPEGFGDPRRGGTAKIV